MNQLLTEMNGVEDLKNVFMISATNRPDMIDPAVLRPGRLGLHLYVPVPNASDRVDILKTVTKKLPLSASVDLRCLSEDPKLEDFTGADLSHLCENAAKLAAWDEGRVEHTITQEDFCRALEKTSCSISKDDLKYYAELNGKFR